MPIVTLLIEKVFRGISVASEALANRELTTMIVLRYGERFMG